jgi:hypothetical protein
MQSLFCESCRGSHTGFLADPGYEEEQGAEESQLLVHRGAGVGSFDEVRIMGGHEYDNAVVGELAEHPDDAVCAGTVEARGRFVGHHNGGLEKQSAGESDTLTFTTAEFLRVSRGTIVDTQASKQIGCPRQEGLGPAAGHGGQQHVL